MLFVDDVLSLVALVQRAFVYQFGRKEPARVPVSHQVHLGEPTLSYALQELKVMETDNIAFTGG